MSEQAEARASVAQFAAEKFKKKHEFILAHINPKPSIQGVYFPPSSCFQPEDITWDPESKILRTIRYIPGERSIFFDEQTKDDVVKKVKQPIEFVNGKKTVEEREGNLLKFMNMHSRNGANPHRDENQHPLFYLYEPNKAFKGIIELKKNTAKAENWCFNAEWEDVRTLARAMNIPMEGIEAAEVRFTLSTYASKDTAKFVAMMDNPAMKRKAVINDAIDANVIVVDKINKTVSWATGGVIINAPPMGKDIMDHLVDSTFTTEGESFFNTLKQQTYPAKEPRSKAPVERPQLGLQTNEEEDAANAFKKFVTEAIAAKLIYQDGSWFTYNDQKALGLIKFRALITPEIEAEIRGQM